MKLSEFSALLGVFAADYPEAEVRMEVYNSESGKASLLNKPVVLSMNCDNTKLTIVGDGVPQKY